LAAKNISNEYLELNVTDSGLGISPANQ